MWITVCIYKQEKLDRTLRKSASSIEDGLLRSYPYKSHRRKALTEYLNDTRVGLHRPQEALYTAHEPKVLALTLVELDSSRFFPYVSHGCVIEEALVLRIHRRTELVKSFLYHGASGRHCPVLLAGSGLEVQKRVDFEMNSMKAL